VKPPPGPVGAPSRQGAEGWFPAAIALWAGTALVVWAGGVLASVLAGEPRAIAFGDAAGAVFSLPGHLSEPARAWSEPLRSALPGPILYWSAQLAVVGAASLLALAAWRIWKRASRPGPGSLGVPTEAGFASARDLGVLAVDRPQAGRVTVGYSRRRLLACEPQASLAVVGPTGCGKTAGFAIPALLEWQGPVIATSVKADLLDATIQHRRRKGEVWVYDPTGCSGEPTSTWSPLEACRTWAGATRVAAWMAEAAQARFDSVTDGDYWYSQARKGLAPYLFAAAHAPGASISDVVRWVDTQDQTEVGPILEDAAEALVADLPEPSAGDVTVDAYRQTLTAGTELLARALLAATPSGSMLAETPANEWPPELRDAFARQADDQLRILLATHGSTAGSDPGSPLRAARALWGKEARLQSSVFATIENVLAGWADPGVGRAARGSEIDPAAWLSGNNTIYVVAPSHEQARLRPVLTVLVQQAIRAAFDSANRAGGTLDHPCLVLLDEAGNTAPLRDLPTYAATARSHGITLVTVWQDLAQVKAAYHDRAQTVLNNHRAKLFGSGIADTSTLEYVSQLVGDEHRTERNIATDLHGGRRSVSEHRTYRRAAPVDVLRRIRTGEAVLLYGSEVPAHVRLRPWFSDSSLRSIAEGRPSGPTGRRRRAP
jgi:type IV secretion system protein VirD4